MAIRCTLPQPHLFVTLPRGNTTWLPCRRRPRDKPETINLALWESNYYRRTMPVYASYPPEAPLQLRQVYLRYQDPPHRNTTFEVDDSALTKNGFTCWDAYPEKFTGNTLMLTSTDTLCIKVYFDCLTNHHLVVGLGHSFGKHWIHVVSGQSNITPQSPWESYTGYKHFEMLARVPEHAQHMNEVRSGVKQVCIMQTRLPQTTRILQISFVMWKSSRIRGVRLDVSGEWTAFDVNVGSYFARLIATDITIYLGNR